MERKKLPVGIDSFEKLRREDFYYVDKTRLIIDLLKNWGEVNLFTRPRRFGKTLNMSMLKSFFEIGTDKTLFDGLDEMDTALEMAGSEPFKTLLITQEIYDRFLYQAYAFPTTFFVDCWGNMIGQPIVGVPSATDSASVYLESINELLNEYA